MPATIGSMGGLGSSVWLAIGAVYCALSVLAGAFGAHGLRARLDERSLELWETAARYFMYTGLGIVALSVAAGSILRRPLDLAMVLLAIGGVIFSGTVAILALGGPRWLGAITPIGGTLLVAGWLAVVWAVLRGA